MMIVRAVSRVFDRAERSLSVFYNHLCTGDIWLYVCVAAFIYLMMNITPFALVLREDAYNFAIKGMEISNGDLSLDRPQAIGWPLLLGLVYSVMSVDDIFEAMYIARWTSIVCMALCVVALGKACRAIWPGTRYKALTIAIVLAFGSAPLIFSAARSAMSEALFLLSVLGVVYFTARATARDEPGLRYLAVAAALTAVSYYVRPNGLFVFAALLITLVLHSPGSRKSLTLSMSVTTMVFMLIIVPYLYARYAAFGSPFDYGANSKYFVDHYEQVWAENVIAPSLWEYVSTHSWVDFYERFIRNGLFAVIHDSGSHLLPAAWPVFSLLGALVIFGYKKREAYLVPAILVVSFAGMSIIYAIFGTIRHLFYFLPLLLLCAGAGFFIFDRYKINLETIAGTAVILAVAAGFPTVVWMGPAIRQLPQVKDHWAVWAANNIEGRVAIVEGGDLLKLSQHYERTGWRVARKFEQVAPNISTWRPGIYQNLDEALIHFRTKGIQYLITDRVHIKRRPYLRDVSAPEWQDTFRHLNYFRLGDKGSQLHEVNIYRIDYN